MKITNISQFIWLCCLALLMTGCKEDVLPFFGEDADIQAGEAVIFTTYAPGVATTRAITQDEFNDRMDSFKTVAQDYLFTVEMYEEGVTEPLGSANYQPTKTITNEGEENETVTYATDGTLVVAETSSPLYWPGNAKRYGFKATAGTTTLSVDQTDADKLLLQDRLLGYGFVPLWNSTANAPMDHEDALNYRTPKEWKAANESLGLSSVEQYKKIPLYLKHQRSLITIILKAGEGVNREDLAYEKALDNIETAIYSYGASSTDKKTIAPLPAPATVNYTASDYGTVANNVATTQYSAVVEPHDYKTGASSDVIAEIKLSGQRFTFYASNDFLYAASSDNAHANHTEAVNHMNGYDLIAGKHLVITATLGRGSRKILITAYVEDWTETVTTSIVDDYGQAGDPIQINSRQELYEFLNNPAKNKPGNVAIIVPHSLNLEQTTETTVEEGVSSTTTKPTPWEPMPLNCTLNMAGATFRTGHQVFSTIGSSGNLVNGTITVRDTTVRSAVAETNLGTIERVNVAPKDANGNNSSGNASHAGLVVTNSGTISECSSILPVRGTATEGTVYVGGIAASSVYSAENGGVMPVIDGCTVDARVDGGAGNRGGGIVGEAVGRVINNTFIYGITISQNTTNFKNIIQTKAPGENQLRAYSNAWPTKASNADVVATNTNRTAVDDRYTAVIDSQAELELLLTTYNNANNKFRLSNDFTVTKASGWNYGGKTVVFNATGTGNVFFKLDGNNKTITTDAMLFSTIQNNVSDLTVVLSADMIATPDGGTDVMAPLAYAVMAGAKISNIQVKGGNHRIQAATVGGIVIWACGKATIENCQCKANLYTWVSGNVSGEAKIYSGGIVANAAQATITRCVFHNTGATLFRNLTGTTGHTGTEEHPLTYASSTIEAETTSSAGIFYGGILGGTAPNSFSGTVEYPSVLITDCTSWFGTANDPQKGAIVGYARYSNASNILDNGIAEGCQGNWWSTSSDGIGTVKEGMTIDQLLGKRNAVTPTQDANY